MAAHAKATARTGGRSARAVETVVVGAGQAGLVMSRLLADAGREHVVLERRTSLGGGWQDRWDAFRLVSPNWTVSVPGLAYQGAEPDGFMPRDEIVDHWRSYADTIAAPVELDTDVMRLVSLDGGAARFRLTTSREAIAARHVVVAGGPFQQPHVPAMAVDGRHGLGEPRRAGPRRGGPRRPLVIARLLLGGLGRGAGLAGMERAG